LPGLAVSQLALRHFRSYKSADLTADARPVALFGANGAGKTNILEAISLLSPGRGIRRAPLDEMGRAPERLGWKISAGFSGPQLAHEVETSAAPGSGARQVRVDGKPAPQLALGAVARILWLVPTMDRLWVEGAEGRRRFLDRMALSLYPDHGAAALGYERAMRERNRLLKDGVTDAAWYRALESQMAESGARLIENRKRTVACLMRAQGEAKTAFPIAELEIASQAENTVMDQDALQQIFAAGRTQDRMAGRTLNGPHRDDLKAVYTAKGTPARNCSTGEQKALLISVILANARAVAKDTGAAPILLLDEVAAHLDENRRAAFYDEICALGAQAWMTGTEASLFAALGKRALFLEVREGIDGSEIVGLSGPEAAA